MTELQYLHHAEQMEAKRRHFALLWERHLLPYYLNVLKLKPKQIQARQQEDWKKFLKEHP